MKHSGFILFLILYMFGFSKSSNAKTFPRLKPAYAVIVLNNMDQNDQDAKRLYDDVLVQATPNFGYTQKEFYAYNTTFMFDCRVGAQDFGTCTIRLIQGPLTTISPDAGKASFVVTGAENVNAIRGFFKTDAAGNYEYISSDKKTRIRLSSEEFSFYFNENGFSEN
jgi:hypothetical protein